MVNVPEIKKYLNRDGLEEYNSMLPHSSTEMQTYVNDWLDEHPEATTTVQDGAISERKLADKSVSLRTLADDTVHMLKGMMLTRESSGEVLAADDAYSAPPVSLTVDGKSTQDGTPTPDAPVEIVSLEQVGLQFAGKNLFDKAAFTNLDNWKQDAGDAYAHFVIKPPAGATVTAHYDGEKLVMTDTYLNFGTRKGSPSNVFLIHNGTTTTNTTVTVTVPEDGKLYFNIYPATAAGKQRVFDAIADILQVELGSTATTYQPYDGTSVLLNLTQALRSLPDGTKDTLALTYLRPSTREGWAWYSRELVQRVGSGNLTISGTMTYTSGNSPNNAGLYNNILRWDTQASFDAAGFGLMYMGSDGQNVPDSLLMSPLGASNYPTSFSASTRVGIAVRNSRTVYIRSATPILRSDFDALISQGGNALVIAPLATPTTMTLDPIELPILPAPECTVWSDPSTGLQMEYVRDSNIVIQRIEQAIADL